MEYFDDFQLGDYKLSDFGGFVINDDGWKVNVAPSTEYITEKVSLKDGELFFGSRLNPRTIPLKVYFEDEVEIEKLSAWLASGKPQVFSYVGDTKEIDVVYDGFLDLECYDDDGIKGIMDISFIAYNPYWRIKNEKHIIFTNLDSTVLSFKGKGNVECYPIIKITPNGTQAEIKFNWNGVLNTLKNVDKEIYLDCENEDLYEIIGDNKVMVSEKYDGNDYWEFPFITPFIKNTFQLIRGNVAKVEIILNSRIK